MEKYWTQHRLETETVFNEIKSHMVLFLNNTLFSFMENWFFFVQHIQIKVLLLQLLQDYPYLPSHQNPHPFYLSLENQQASEVNDKKIKLCKTKTNQNGTKQIKENTKEKAQEKHKYTETHRTYKYIMFVRSIH